MVCCEVMCDIGGWRCGAVCGMMLLVRVLYRIFWVVLGGTVWEWCVMVRSGAGSAWWCLTARVGSMFVANKLPTLFLCQFTCLTKFKLISYIYIYIYIYTVS